MQVRSIREHRKRWLAYINYCQQGPKSLFQNGKGKRSDDSKLPSPAEIETFWTEVLGQPGTCQTDDPSIVAFIDQCNETVAPSGDSEVSVFNKQFAETTKRVKNWKAPGKYLVHVLVEEIETQLQITQGSAVGLFCRVQASTSGL